MSETELHPDDRLYLNNLTIGCARGSHGHLERVAAVAEPDARRYLWRCGTCGQHVSLVIPEAGSRLEAEIASLHPEAAARPETELHPDDGVPLSAIGFYADWPGSRLLRLDKEVLGSKGRRTEYLFGPTKDAASIYVVVAHRGTTPAGPDPEHG